jgi:hypothetical protein
VKAGVIPLAFCDAWRVQFGHKMQQHSMVAYFALKGPSICEVHDDFEAVFGLSAVADGSTIRYLREPRFPPSSADPASVNIPWCLHDSDQAVLSSLKER